MSISTEELEQFLAGGPVAPRRRTPTPTASSPDRVAREAARGRRGSVVRTGPTSVVVPDDLLGQIGPGIDIDETPNREIQPDIPSIDDFLSGPATPEPVSRALRARGTPDDRRQRGARSGFGILPALGRGVAGLVETTGETIAAAPTAFLESLPGATAPSVEGDPVQRIAQQIGRPIARAGRAVRESEALRPSPSIEKAAAEGRLFRPTDPRFFTEELPESAVSLAASIAAAVATRNAAPLARFLAFSAPTVSLEGGASVRDIREQLIEQGVSPEEAHRISSEAGAQAGILAAGLEVGPFSAITGRLGGRFARRGIVRATTTAAAEAQEEVAQTISGEAVRSQATGTPFKVDGQELARAALGGAVLGGAAGVVISGGPRGGNNTDVTGAPIGTPAPTISPPRATVEEIGQADQELINRRVQSGEVQRRDLLVSQPLSVEPADVTRFDIKDETKAGQIKFEEGEEIRMPASMAPDGRIVEAPVHYLAQQMLVGAAPGESFDHSQIVDGFTTSSGRLLSREQAMELINASELGPRVTGETKLDAWHLPPVDQRTIEQEVSAADRAVLGTEGGFLNFAPSRPSGSPFQSNIAEVEEAWRAARGLGRPALRDRIFQAIADFKNHFTPGRHFQNLDTRNPKFAATADILRLFQGSGVHSQLVALNRIAEVESDLVSREESDLVARALALPDILRSVDEGLYDDKQIPFGYPNREAVVDDLDALNRVIGSNPRIAQAVQKRNDTLRPIVERLVELNLLEPKAVDNLPRYYHRQVLERVGANSSVGVASRTVRMFRRGFQIARTGGGDFNTAWREAEFEWITHALSQIAKKETILRVKRINDIKDSLVTQAKTLSEQEGRDVNWQDLIPEGHVIWQPEPGNTFFNALTITEQTLDKFLAESGDALGLSERLREALVMGGPREQWVIPEELAVTLNNLSPETVEGPAAALSRRLLTRWKKWRLLNPFGALRYNFNNASGDMDIVLAWDPRALKLAPRAAIDLAKDLRNRSTPLLRAEIEEGTRRAVLGSTLTIQEIPDIGKSQVLKALDPKGRLPSPWRAVTKWTIWRENIIRLATWRYIRQLMIDNPGKPIYGASRAHEVDAITNVEERAAKVARELVGDYGNLSEGGQWLRRQVMPFYSWIEINSPRYYQLLRNLPKESRATPGRAGGQLAGAAALRVGTKAALFAVKANLLFALVHVYNHVAFPDEEKELRSELGREPQLILGRDQDGRIRTLRLPGALSDMLSWLDLSDLPADIRDLTSGRATLADKGAEAVKAPVERAVQSLRPEAALVGVLAGKSFYPHIFAPNSSFRLTGGRFIRDRREAVAGVLAMERVYRFATGRPRPVGGWPADFVESLMIYKTDPGEAAYFESRRLAFQWLEDVKGRSSDGIQPGKKGNALFYFKQATKYGDTEGARRWIREYAKLGGTLDGMKQSIDRSAPAGTIPKKDRPEFAASLSDEELEVFRLGNRWYNETFR